MIDFILGVLFGMLICALGIAVAYREEEISSPKPNDVIITKDNRVAVFLNYHRNFDHPNIKDDIIYIVKDIHTNIVRVIGKSTVKSVIKQNI